jgi:tRNA A-37 threonylcarbamoyl transferase component Bud32
MHTTAGLSEAREGLAATSSGELVFFGGGRNATGPSDRVDICNVTSGSWTTATLCVPRAALTAASSGNLVLFAGGGNLRTMFSDKVDIYDISKRSWSTAKLSQARYNLTATSVRNFVLFGGGFNSNVVDIYNVTINTWTNAKLSQARYCLAATSVANRYSLFAGGWTGTGVSNVVDIYDSETGTWSTATLSQARGRLVAASLGNLAFFAGGQLENGNPSDRVDIFDTSTQTWSTATLSEARYGLAAAAADDFVVFGGGTVDYKSPSAVVDLYCLSNKTWYTARLSEPRHWLAAASVGNKVFFAGGYNKNDEKLSDLVDIFEVPIVGSVASSQPQTQSSSTTNSNSNVGFDISYSDLKFGDLIGRGAFGEVYKATYRGNLVAVKKLFVTQGLSQSDELQIYFACFRKEIEILSSLNHLNILKCLGGCIQPSNLCIVTEYCNGGSLCDLLHVRKIKISTQQQISFALGIAEGMEYLHSLQPMIVHRDLKSHNILLNDNITKICDFGISQTKGTLTSALHTKAGTYNWMAPEMMESNSSYTEKVDVWSFGMVLYELATNTIPYDYCKDNVPFLTREVCDKKKTPPIPEGQVIDPTLLSLMQQCWNWDPQQRPSFSQIVLTLKDAKNRKW